ncbi:unnamed protein product [Prunus armeniaca]|uniref:Uncharacterized protein n=1 Tax=Prunus armeniaca TaxID=36596 RepID=A0A6J5Y5U3_PRUAR|nr:unnamed protein product [Prunus armeniaca]
MNPCRTARVELQLIGGNTKKSCQMFLASQNQTPCRRPSYLAKTRVLAIACRTASIVGLFLYSPHTLTPTRVLPRLKLTAQPLVLAKTHTSKSQASGLLDSLPNGKEHSNIWRLTCKLWAL